MLATLATLREVLAVSVRDHFPLSQVDAGEVATALREGKKDNDRNKSK